MTLTQRLKDVGLAATTAALLTACSTADTPGATEPTVGTSSNGTVASTKAPSRPAATSSGTGQLDSSAKLGPEQLLTLRAASLREEAKSMNLSDPPDVKLVRWTDMSNFAPTIVKCFTEQGFGAHAEGGTQLQFDQVPKSQERAFNLALYTCEAQYTIHPALTLPPSKDALAKVYDWYVNTSVPCLQAAGVDVTPPPSKSTFVETMYTKSGAAWTPWMSVPREIIDSPTKFKELEQKCPQAPDASAYLENAPAPTK